MIVFERNDVVLQKYRITRDSRSLDLVKNYIITEINILETRSNKKISFYEKLFIPFWR